MRRRLRFAPLGVLAVLVLLTGAMAPMALAQETGTEGTADSVSREDYYTALFEKYPMEPAPAKGGTVIASSTSDLRTVNQLLAADSASFAITQLIYEAMVSVSVVDGTPIPGLADSWEIADDGVTYTFHLNKDAKWHDGEDFTANDVKFSVDTLLNPELASPYASSVDAVLESYQVIDDDTFQAVSAGPIATFIIEFGLYVGIMPQHIWGDVAPADWQTDPGSTGTPPEEAVERVIGTGPFKFKEWVQGDHATVVRNDTYWDPNAIPNIDEFTIQVVPDSAAEVAQLKTGAVDMVEVIPAPDTADIEATEGLKVIHDDSFSFSYFAFNLDPAKTTLFQDVRVREAFVVGLDRQAVTDTIYLGYGEVGIGTQPKLSPAYAPDQIEKKYDYDPERARQLLEEAGWTDTNGDGTRDKDGQEFSFDLLTIEGGGAVAEQVISYVQEAWRELGIEANPTFRPFPVFLDETGSSRNFDMYWGGFNWDVTANQGAMFECAAYEGGFNDMKYCNPEYDRLNELARKELDPEKRIDYLIEATNIVNNDLPIFILRFGTNRYGFNDRLHNFHPNGYSYLWSLPFVWVEE